MHSICPILEPLETRVLLSADPSPREQYMLALINRARTDPVNELPLLLNANDRDVNDALSFFRVSLATLQNQWDALVAVPPLAWNDILATTAEAHSQQMLSHDAQEHQFAGEPDLGTRIDNAGYNWSNIGENIYAFGLSVFHTDAGFLIDWGDGPNGIQDPPGHRDNLFSPDFREVGISIIDGLPGKQTGPLLTTEDFGNRFDLSAPILLGAAFDDMVRHDNFYTIGEGLGGLTITATRITDQAVFTATTTASGGYQMELAPGTYEVSAAGPALGSSILRTVSVGSDNVELDFSPPSLPDLRGAFSTRAPVQLKPNAIGRGTLRITNPGTLTASGNMTTDFYLSADATLDSSDSLVATVPTALFLTPGRSKNVAYKFSAPLTLPGGQYFLLADVDSSDQIAELSESNNAAVAPGTTKVIPPFTNLIPVVNGPAKRRLLPGSTLPFSLRLRNTGNVPATGTVSAAVQLRPLSNPALPAIDLGFIPDFAISIKPGSPKAFALSLLLPGDLAPDKYRIVVTITALLATLESNLADNTAVAAAMFAVP